jgi:hypothetical protein
MRNHNRYYNTPSGVFGLDSAPLDHRNFESFHELRSVVDTAYNFRLKDKPRAEIEERLKKEVEVR